MISVDEFLDESGLCEQFQLRVVEVVNKYGVKALTSENFTKMIDSFIGTALISYAIAGIASKNKSNTTEELQAIMDQIIEEMSPGSTGAVVELKEDENAEEVMNMYHKASANTLPC